MHGQQLQGDVLGHYVPKKNEWRVGEETRFSYDLAGWCILGNKR